jgi:hypothetical protein
VLLPDPSSRVHAPVRDRAHATPRGSTVWSKITDRAPLALSRLAVAVACAWLSFDALAALAVRVGVAEHSAWLVPVLIDAGALAGTIAWRRRSSTATERTVGRRLSLSLIFVSMVGNALEHAAAAVDAGRGAWVVASVGLAILPPPVLATVLHMDGPEAQDAGRLDAGRLDVQDLDAGRPDLDELDGDEQEELDGSAPDELDAGRDELDELDAGRPGDVQDDVPGDSDEFDRVTIQRAVKLRREGLGRTKLMQELGLGEGPVKRLIKIADEHLTKAAV